MYWVLAMETLERMKRSLRMKFEGRRKMLHLGSLK